jgi:hypothetical protein
LENLFGTDPSVWNAGLVSVSSDGAATTFLHPQNDAQAPDVSGSYEWSVDLSTWHASGETVDGTTVDITASRNTPDAGTTTVTAIAAGTIPGKLFLRTVATQATP